MRLSPAIIYYRLLMHCSASYIKKPSCSVKAGRPVLFSHNTDMSGHTVLVSADELGCSLPDGSVYIAAGQVDGSAALPDCHIISLEGIYAQDAFNLLQEIYNTFDEWERSLENTHYENKGFAELIECCGAVMYDPCGILDDELQYVAYSQFSDTDAAEHPDEIVNEFITISRNREVNTCREAFPLSFTFGDGILKNLFRQEKLIGRIAVYVNSKDTALFEYYADILELLSGYAERLYDKFRTFYHREIALDSIRATLADCLESGNASSIDWNGLLSEVKWRSESCYQLAQFRPNPRYDNKIYSKHTVNEIEKMWQGCICFTHRDRLILLVNLSRFVSGAGGGFYQSLAYFLRDNLLAAGISREFNNLRQITSAYEQTTIALDVGVKIDPTMWYYKFDNYALNYMLLKCAGAFYDIPDMLCSEKLVKLRTHDSEKNTEYYKTLKMYFMCNLNASEAAAKLFIHRSSFLNRMNRIQEIANINFGSFDERLYLSMSFKIFERSDD